jgi:hypothetical protein
LLLSGNDILGIESDVAWATPGTFTVENVPCSEDGSMCGGQVNDLHGATTMQFVAQEYVDPSVYLADSTSVYIRQKE